jgi:hypothetical protein
MKYHTSKQKQHQQEHNQQHHHSASETQVIEFASPEEALRYDAAQTVVPPRVAERLRESIEREPRPAPASWWQRMFGG